MRNLTKTAKMELFELCDMPTIRCLTLAAIQHGSKYNGFLSCNLIRESYAMIIP